MSAVANILGYQVVWFVAVYGAGAGFTWPAVATAGVFAAWQLAASADRALDLRLIALSLLCGLLLDGALAYAGLLHYAANSPALPPSGAPLWILALWVAFALTLNHSLRCLKARPLTAALVGVAGGQLAYLAAGRLSGAVSFATPSWRALACLAAGWGTALALLAQLAASGTRTGTVDTRG
jgi:hypothetical protein